MADDTNNAQAHDQPPPPAGRDDDVLCDAVMVRDMAASLGVAA